MLAVNLWTIDRTYSLHTELEKESLFDMNSVANMTHQEIFARLMNAGYSRGDYITGLLADRLMNLAKALSGQGLSRLCSLLEQRNIKEMDAWLLNIKGIGPYVLENFKILQGLDKVAITD